MSPRSFHIWRILAIALLAFVITPAVASNAGEITIAAAADLTVAFKDIGARFQKETGNSVRISYGSSGNFFAQIRNGAPYDIFFSADVAYPEKLEAAGLTEPGTLYDYATGKLVIWIPAKSKLDIHQGLKVLLDPGISKIAIANPQHAPYGAAAVAALRREKIYDRVKAKFVKGENIAQTANFVQSGNADVGLIALSLALAPAMQNAGRYVEVPAADYPPIIQAAVILKSARHPEIAKWFLNFLKEPATVALMGRYGFLLPS
ncbi:MAG: molybdate ABC transporter substrate-binding protein, partial [Candidatus Binataceae bacterium]